MKEYLFREKHLIFKDPKEDASVEAQNIPEGAPDAVQASPEQAKEEVTKQTGSYLDGLRALMTRFSHQENLSEALERELVLTGEQKELAKNLIELRLKLDEKVREFESLTKEKKMDYVHGLRSLLLESRTLLRMISDTLSLEAGDLMTIKLDGDLVDLAEMGDFFADVDSLLKEVKGEGKESLSEEIDKQRDSISVKDFLALPLEQRLILVSNLKSWDELGDKKLITFHFGKNDRLQQRIGLGDLMPANIREISWNGENFIRRGGQGFYNKGEYLAIYTGTKVEIKSTVQGYSPEREHKEIFGERKLEAEAGEALQVAQNFLVDEELLLSLYEVMGEGEDQFEFYHQAARFLQNAEMKFRKKFEGKNPVENGHYSVDFVVFALDRFNLFNHYAKRNEQSIREVLEKYSQLEGVAMELKEENLTLRQENEKTEVSGYDFTELIKPSAEMQKEMEDNLAAFKAALEKEGVEGEELEKRMRVARQVYQNMYSHLGNSYWSKVVLKKNGRDWAIQNSCVGGAMKAFDGVMDLKLRSGSQEGKLFSNYYWGEGIPFGWLRSMLPAGQEIRSASFSPSDTPAEIDSKVGADLLPGEMAAAGFDNHAAVIFKDAEGRVMMYHSGGDFRPSRIKVASPDQLPYGYEMGEGGFAYKQKFTVPDNALGRKLGKVGESSSNKVNILPLSTYVKKNRKSYVKFVPLRSALASNM